jgi:hypothetical protein
MKNESLTLLKWLAIVFMVIDHVNKFLFTWRYPVMFDVGRLALPLFMMVFAFNMARPGLLTSATAERVMKRLLAFGVASSVPFIALGTGLLWKCYPLNILFAFIALALALWFAARKQPVCAVAAFILGGALVEYWWAGLLIGLGFWLWFRNKRRWGSVALFVGFLALCFLNDNFYALLALPLIWGVSKIHLPLPRCKWFFYWFYPLHLVVLLCLKFFLR